MDEKPDRTAECRLSSIRLRPDHTRGHRNILDRGRTEKHPAPGRNSRHVGSVRRLRHDENRHPEPDQQRDEIHARRGRHHDSRPAG